MFSKAISAERHKMREICNAMTLLDQAGRRHTKLCEELGGRLLLHTARHMALRVVNAGSLITAGGVLGYIVARSIA